MSDKQENPQTEDQDRDGLFKKPMSGSFKRVGERLDREMQEKTPAEAVRDDLSGQPEPTDEERENLEGKVEETKADTQR